MPLIRAFAKEKEDLELIWLAGFKEDPDRGWLVRAVTRGTASDHVVFHALPIGLLPVLALGRCYAGGDLARMALHGKLATLHIPNVAEGEEAAVDCIPPDLFPIKGRDRKVQRLLRYQVNGVEILVPTIELVRALFIHNKTLANALMRPGGIMELCRPEMPGLYPDLHLRFTERMPRNVLNDSFVSEFAWIAIHPDARRSWDSVAEQSKGQQFVSFQPPPLPNSTWTVRWVREKGTALVLEIHHITGKHHPCDVLRYSHPGMSETVTFRPKDAVRERADSPDEPQAVREIRDYVVDDRATGSQIDAYQSALPVLTKPSSFDREIEIIAVVNRTAEPAGRPDQGGGDPPPPSRPPTPENVVHRRIRVSASVAEEQIGATLPPVEFKLLDPADPDYLGGLEPLIRALHLMAEMLPTVRMAMSLCALKGGRAISRSGTHRRPCLIAILWPPSGPPMVLMDVDHTGDVSLSCLLLRYTKPLPFREMEEHIKALLDGMVDNHGRWNTDLADAFKDACDGTRMPRVLRHKKRMDEQAYWMAWATRLADRLGLIRD